MRSPDLELLLEQARGAVPQSGAKARLRSRVLAAAVGGAALTTAAHAAAAKSVSWLAALKGSQWSSLSLWIAGGTALGSLVIAPVLWSMRETSPAAPAATTPNVAPAVLAPNFAPTTPPPPTAPSPPEQPRVASAPSHPLMPSIERETALLREAQRALGSGNARAALSWLDRYDREIGHGSLGEEAAAARAVATCTLSKAGAVATLVAFRTLYPASPLLPRVQSACSSGTSHDDFELDSRNPATKTQER